MKLAVLVLAAGKGTRMKSRIPKILHPILGIPMIKYVLNSVNELKPDKVILVVGKDDDKVKSELENYRVEYTYQSEQLGTGHAAKCAESALKRFNGNILIVNGDFPLITSKTLKNFLKHHINNRSGLSLMIAELENPTGYGRIIRDNLGNIADVIEEKDCTTTQKKIKEINAGSYLVESKILWQCLDKISDNNAQNEYYLPDMVRISLIRGIKISAYESNNSEEMIGINDRYQLYMVESIMKMRINKGLMQAGVHIIDPASTYISPLSSINQDTTIYPNSFVIGESVIGENTVIGASTWIEDSKIGKNVHIKMNCWIEKSKISDNVQIGPFAHIRPDTVIASNSKIGNFVELKNSKIGNSSKVPHLSYIGDATLGNNVNIGAGTITCNYDGFKKHKTIIEDDVFIGSDTMLVAPLKIGKNSTTGAGSTITKDVDENSLAISRAKQTMISNWIRKPKL